METKSKINKWNLIKLENLCTGRETIKKIRRQTSEWEKLIANEATDEGLTSKIYKHLIQLNISSSYSSIAEKQTTQSKNGQKTKIDISPKKT